MSEDVKPYLRMVGSPENDPERPSVVWAKGLEKQYIELVAEPDTVRRFEDTHLNSKIGEYCGLVHGGVPQGTRGLLAAHALFQGLKRPCIKVGHDDEICAYVLNPEFTFSYPRNAKNSGQGPIRDRKPVNAVFVVYSDLTELDLVLPSGTKVKAAGKILYWEWVLADPNDPSLPEDYKNRYSRQIW